MAAPNRPAGGVSPQGQTSGVSSPQSMLAAQGGNRPPALRGTLDAAVRGGIEAAVGGGRGTAPKVNDRLQRQAASATAQWLAEDKRIRDLRQQVYGGDYQRSRARSFYFQQRGITPHMVERATRTGALSQFLGMG